MKDQVDTDTHSTESRRDFLLSTGRYAAVAAITYSMGKFIVRAMGEECVNNSICDACLAVKNCGLPLGLEFKGAAEAGESPQPDMHDEPQNRESVQESDHV